MKLAYVLLAEVLCSHVLSFEEKISLFEEANEMKESGFARSSNKDGDV